MPSLNYHHLLYFWTVAKEGTIARAAEVLELAQPTISGQVKALESSLGEQLFVRAGRTLRLTETGEMVYRYADEIFGLGREMVAALQGRPTGQPQRLQVGISDAVPKVITHRILSPALDASPPVSLVCRESSFELLIAELSNQSLDLVLSDQPVSGRTDVKTYNHLLGETSISFFAPPGHLDPPSRGFPECLDGAPLLVPAAGSPLRRALEQWCDAQGVRPRVVGEFEDSALMKEFGRNGAGVFPSPTAVESVICREYGVHVVGRTRDITERFYAITAERRVEPPSLSLIIETARARIF